MRRLKRGKLGGVGDGEAPAGEGSPLVVPRSTMFRRYDLRRARAVRSSREQTLDRICTCRAVVISPQRPSRVVWLR